MNKRLSKISAVLAFVVGIMAVVAGGKVLLGQMPDYYVIDWVPVYNFLAGLVSAFIASILLWKNGKFALPTAALMLTSHTLVMIILQTAYRDVVAPDSIRAMTIRIAAWSVILTIMVIQNSKNRRRSSDLSLENR